MTNTYSQKSHEETKPISKEMKQTKHKSAPKRNKYVVNDIDLQQIEKVIHKHANKEKNLCKEYNILKIEVALCRSERHVMKEETMRKGLEQEELRMNLHCSQLISFLTSQEVNNVKKLKKILEREVNLQKLKLKDTSSNCRNLQREMYNLRIVLDEKVLEKQEHKEKCKEIKPNLKPKLKIYQRLRKEEIKRNRLQCRNGKGNELKCKVNKDNVGI